MPRESSRALTRRLEEVFIATNSRTVVSYLLRPLNDQLHRAFKDR